MLTLQRLYNKKTRMRDKSLDIVKGIACILMIFAHSHSLGRTIDNDFTYFFWYLGFFAPIIFFASIGAALIYQLKKRSLYSLIIFNLLLFLISFANLGRESIEYLDITKNNLIGSLALSTIFTLIYWEINGLFVFIILLILDRFLNTINLTPTILHGILFALIPWSGITTLGKYLHKNKKNTLFVFVIGILITFYYLIIKREYITTQFLTSSFLGVSLLIYSFCLLVAPMIGKVPILSLLLTFLGKNSLLFYFLHLFILFTITFKLQAVLMWIFILVSSIIFMLILKSLNHYTLERISSLLWFWVVLVSAIFVPLLFKFPQQFQFYFFSILTIIFALNYKNLFKLKIIGS